MILACICYSLRLENRCCIVDSLMKLSDQTLQEDWRSQVILERLSHVLFVHCKPCLLSEHVLLDLRLEAPRVDIVLELDVVLEHLCHSSLFAAHPVQ